MQPAFAGAAIDRAGERRVDASWVAERLADPASRSVVVTPAGIALKPDGLRLARVPLDEILAGEPILLGIEEDGAALFAVRAGEPPPGTRAAGLREAALLLGPQGAGLAAYATAMVNWHAAHPRCARCGAATRLAEGGHVRLCPQCGAQHHPRTDPVVIMLVTRGDDEVLLGRQATWPEGRYSALAGFVEPGESLEDAVAREVREESGVEIAAPRYVASQPWPFPTSLMLGFSAEHAAGEPSVRDEELEDVRWFTRAEIEAAAAGEGDLRLPPPEAIARTLLDHWLLWKS